MVPGHERQVGSLRSRMNRHKEGSPRHGNMFVGPDVDPPGLRKSVVLHSLAEEKCPKCDHGRHRLRSYKIFPGMDANSLEWQFQGPAIKGGHWPLGCTTMTNETETAQWGIAQNGGHGRSKMRERESGRDPVGRT